MHHALYLGHAISMLECNICNSLFRKIAGGPQGPESVTDSDYDDGEISVLLMISSSTSIAVGRRGLRGTCACHR